jgi:RNA polymerase sigma factor for flagellar operon FliA
MAKSSAAVSSPRSVPTPSNRLRAVEAMSTSRNTASPAPAGAPVSDGELEIIWRTFKRTRDENLRNTLIEHHMPLVRAIAERVLQTLPKSIELDDLSSAGTFGLMDAINGFDLSRGIKFKTYCTTRIRGSILDELRSQDWVPRLVRLKAHRLDRAIRQLEGELGRAPNQSEIASALGITLDELHAHEAEANAKTIFSLSEKWDDGDEEKEMEKIEILADRKSVDPVDTIQQHDALEMITGSLTKKERLIILMYYYEGLTMREIGEIMELTESRVCQIHSNVMARLKAQLDRTPHGVA